MKPTLSALHGRVARHMAAAMIAFCLLGCAGATVEQLRNPVPEALVPTAAVPGYSGIRYWGDDAASLPPSYLDKVAQQQAAAGTSTSDRYFLSVSGGGSNGAFGAGLLIGWNDAGTRPEFTVITGVSTGSLIAPFALLGKPYDDDLRAAYTEITAEDIFKRRSLFGIIGSESVADNTPLRRLVARYITDAMLDDIVREHNRGRRLLIGTTNIDAERPVVWDIGAIAASGQPGRKQLIQDILVASASIPGVFPPVRISVVADGQSFDELHVDGGTSNQAFLFPSNFSVRHLDKKTGVKRNRTLFVIRNGKVTPEHNAVRPRLASIAGRSLGSLIKAQGVGDLYRIYSNAQRDGIAFNAIWIPPSFTMKEPAPFDHDYMQALFDLGYRMGINGIPWEKQPP